MHDVQLRAALISVFHKTGLEPLLRSLHTQGVALYSTGGTADYIRGLGLPVTDISDVTGFPSILDGRVKTLHPKVFGGILAIRGNATHEAELAQHALPTFDLVLVDLYPFEDTVRATTEAQQIIEKIDIGGIALIRAAAKNHRDVWIIPSAKYYSDALQTLEAGKGSTTLAQRRRYAAHAFEVSSSYDRAIMEWSLMQSAADSGQPLLPGTPLRYGENPHQAGAYVGNLELVFEKLGGKELSYNNLLDVDGALRLVAEFMQEKPTCAIIKHTNPCGVATRKTAFAAWQAALAADPTSAFGGIIAFNTEVGADVAQALNDIFFEVVLAPAFTDEALTVLRKKQNRIILKLKEKPILSSLLYRTALNGLLVQQSDEAPTDGQNYKYVTPRQATPAELADAIMAEKLVKHLKSNAIVLVKNSQMIGAGQGQTSRVDAVLHALAKARAHGHDPKGSVLASDAFFPFPDSVELAHEAGIGIIVQPGGSVKDEEVTKAATANGQCMIFTGLRHFRH